MTIDERIVALEDRIVELEAEAKAHRHIMQEQSHKIDLFEARYTECSRALTLIEELIAYLGRQ